MITLFPARRAVSSVPVSLVRSRAPLLVLSLASALALAGCKGGEAPTGDASTSAVSGPVSQGAAAPEPKAWVRTYLDKEMGGGLGKVHVHTARVDLDGDGTDEILAYASGAMLCGTGGCELLVLKSENGSYRVVGDLSVVQLPVGVLDTKTQGWRDLAVSVSGGGMPGAIRRVPFEGTRYASNPTDAGLDNLDSLGKVLLTPEMLLKPDTPDSPDAAKPTGG